MARRSTLRTDFSQPPDDRTYSPEVTSFEQSPGSSQFRGAGRSLPVAYLPIIKENSPSVKREFEVFYENSRFFRFSVFSLSPCPAPPSAADVIDGTGGPRAAPTGYPAGSNDEGCYILRKPLPRSCLRRLLSVIRFHRSGSANQSGVCCRQSLKQGLPFPDGPALTRHGAFPGNARFPGSRGRKLPDFVNNL